MEILSVLEREVKTSLKPIRIMCIYVDTLYSDYPSSYSVPIDVPFNTVCGSIIIGMTSKTNTTPISPLEYNTNCYIQNSNVNYLKRVTSGEVVSLYINNSVLTSVNALSNRGNCIICFVIDPNDKVIGCSMTNYLSLYFDGSVTDNYMEFIPATNDNFGRITGGVQSTEVVLQSVNVRKATSTTQTQLQSIYDGSAIPDNDPYVNGGGSSGGGGGEGDFDDTSDTISIPSLPSINGLNTGFFTAFVCTQSQLQEVSNYLWTDVISDILDTTTGLGEKVDALKKMVTSPYDAIMGCSLVPVSPPTGGSKEVKMYGVVKTGISLPYASSRWVEVDCGTLNIHEFWGSYLDYSPYTKTTSLYLPYIGVVSVDIDLIMSKALQVVYHVDILSGICIAYIVVDGSVKFQYQGHCSTSIPVTSSDFSGAIQSGLGLVGNIANVVSSGFSGGAGGSIGGAVLGATKSAISQAPSVASNVMGMKPDIKSGGGVGSSGGILGVQKPFLIIERPNQSVPAFQNGFSGYPCNMTKKLSDLTGYTEVERINLTNISLTEDEKNELLEILESGVYL